MKLDRQSLLAAALSVAAWATVTSASENQEHPMNALEGAVAAAEWLAATAFETDGLARWHVAPGQGADGELVDLSLYHGVPGVVLFLTELQRHHDDPRWRRLALSGADGLVADLERLTSMEDVDSGLYNGLAGIGSVLIEVDAIVDDPRYRRAVEQVIEALADRALDVEGGIAWNDTTDVIAGSAGIGLFLLRAHQRLGSAEARRLAIEAGDGLIATGHREPRVGDDDAGGLRWAMTPDDPRNLPNFSHGTAGVAYFLADLYRFSQENTHLDAALAGARYLQSIADTGDGDLCLIYHHDPGGEQLHYLSWCHGPAGTSRLFHLLGEITGDAKWERWVERSAQAVLVSGAPEQQTPGFWNNVSQCCGSAGLLDFFLSLYRRDPQQRYLDYAHRVGAQLLEASTSEGKGAKWTQAEHRTQPDLLFAQTGYMQGAAGVGLALLRLHLVERGKDVEARLPDTPY